MTKINHVYRNLLYFHYKNFSSGFGMYENCLHSCGLYTMGLVITKILLIEILLIKIKQITVLR